ncbi:OpgC domain-containing protein, partial [Pseudacidovorax intermedius]|uniref:OpgC domain-containing protein n=1 Tax=Pseudacidovorax intermedius TaxID=433924 RepID=UPI0026EE479C
MRRLWEIDALRGLMLVLMTVTHLPSRLTDPLGQPFGFVSAAEGFVLLSAFVCGLVYGGIGHQKGVAAMRQAFWRRAVTVYLCQAALLLFLFFVIAGLGLRADQPAVHERVRYFIAYPHQAFVWALALVHEPALLDILPMYILFMLASPWVMAYGMRHGWKRPLMVSAGLWLLAQFGFTNLLYRAAQALLGIPVPIDETGSFDSLAWQFLWFAGLWLGCSRHDAVPPRLEFPVGVVRAAVVTVIVVMLWRHLGPTGQAPFGSHDALNEWFDKWRLAPLRLLNLVAIGIVVLRFGPTWLRHLPRPRVLETLGSASLSVFCAHLVAVFVVLVVWGGDFHVRPWWGDALMLGVV